MNIENVAVVGAGTMGNGIAHVCALAGVGVALVDLDAAALDRAMAAIDRNLERQRAKGRIGAGDRAGALGRIEPATGLERVGRAELVVEAVPEIADLKFEIFAELDRLAPKDAILASNTSSISITAIAARTSRPGEGRRDALHEPGPGHEAGRGHPRSAHGRRRPWRP